MMKPLSLRANRMLQILENAAGAGERCPTNERLTCDGFPAVAPALDELIDKGWIRVEVYGRNWRTVWICKGEHAGKCTKPDPKNGEPYLTRGPARPVAAPTIERSARHG